MYTLIRLVPVSGCCSSRLRLSRFPFAIAEAFYKFHSFTSNAWPSSRRGTSPTP